jgi:hypothetical protein
MRNRRFTMLAIMALLNVAVAASDWKPAPSSLSTTWGEEVGPDNVWTEYPRPQLERPQWSNLNGLWNYAVAPTAATRPASWDGRILVPFALEAPLSGVGRRLKADEALWYQRQFDLKSRPRGRLLLHFEAVDYASEVWVNGKSVCTNTGGNLPFSADITAAVKAGANELVVRVVDATDTPGTYQLHGKQVRKPGGIWYTPVSGIWQTVWLEEVPANHIVAAKITPSISGRVSIELTTTGRPGKATVVGSLAGKEVARVSGASKQLTLNIPNPKLWSPDSPTLYDLTITLGSDTVRSYVGLRETTVIKDAAGHLRLALNGKELFHFGTLDQGWWPDGLLTPPSDAAMVSDIEFLKAAGFNTIRKHIKVEPRRYYTHCDRLGMLVWQDQVSSGTGKDRDNSTSPAWTRLRPNPVDANWPDSAHRQFMFELKLMMDTLHNHPSIVQWVPFNEAWGQHRTMAVGEWSVAYDPTRQINIASGGNFWPVGHIVDHHQYPHPSFPFNLGQGGRFDGFVKIVGEFGGHGFPVEGHLWDPKAKNWGYGGLPKDKEEWIERYKTSIAKLAELKQQGIAGAIYTQTTDVEPEINGLLTYDRKVRKLDAGALATIHRGHGIPAGKATPADLGATDPGFLNIPKAAVAPVQPAMSRPEIEAGLKSHDRALYIKEGWIRDPYITLGPDDFYYLTGTTINENDPREQTDPYNIGLGDESAVGDTVRVWKSKDLIDWQYLGVIFDLKHDSAHRQPGNRVWAPEVHWIPELNRWALLHCPKQKSNLGLSSGPELKGPWTHPMGTSFAGHHDPSIYQDGDTWWVLSENTVVQPLAPDFSRIAGPKTRIDPAGQRTNALGRTLSVIGHEGATMMKVGGRYVHLGTAWSTDQGRKGSYNLYYCTSDKINGTYGPRKFAGRFLGHGTPFQTRDGQWWCTAFFNANVPPLTRDGIEKRDLSETAQTINQRGTTIVPLDVRVLSDGEIYIRAKDPAYATPGPDEVQKF